MIRLSKSCLTDIEKNAVKKVLDAEFLGMGKEVFEFEETLSDFFGRGVACVSSGTAALHLALQAAQVTYGDEVLVPSMTYVASFQAISAVGAIPVACDISIETLQLDLNDARERITENTKAIMPVYYGGGAHGRQNIFEFSNEHNLNLVEDAAHAFGSYENGVLVGSDFGVTCFSFDGIKNITCGEGGCVVSSDTALLDRVRTARLLGVENDTARRRESDRSWFPDVTVQGWRYHMNNVSAAIGMAQFNRFDDLRKKRQSLAKHYDSGLREISSLATLKSDYDYVVPHVYPIRMIGCDFRNELRKRLHELKIETGIHYFPNHLLSKYQNPFALPLPVTERVFPELLTLPLHPDLEVSDLDYIIDALKRVFKHG